MERLGCTRIIKHVQCSYHADEQPKIKMTFNCVVKKKTAEWAANIAAASTTAAHIYKMTSSRWCRAYIRVARSLIGTTGKGQSIEEKRGGREEKNETKRGWKVLATIDTGRSVGRYWGHHILMRSDIRATKHESPFCTDTDFTAFKMQFAPAYIT